MGLICLFAFCSLVLALMGGQAYRQIQAGVDDAFGSNVAASYLGAKLVQNNTAGAVALRGEGDDQILTISMPIGDEVYETRIYLHDGQLKETLVLAGEEHRPNEGMSIAQVRSCRFGIAADGLFTAELVSPAGVRTRVAFALLEGGVAQE